MKLSDLDHVLLDPARNAITAPDTFSAILNAHGSYSSMQFVLRLSPRIHQLIDSIPPGIHTFAAVSPEIIQAYSTYLHETVHWWQHVGSTAGLVLSLGYPGQLHVSMDQLKNVAATIGGKKSLKKWAERQMRNGVPNSDPILSQANTAVNNASDVEFYKAYALRPSLAEVLFDEQYFESVGHCFHIAYAHTLSQLSDFDPELGRMPNAAAWEAEFMRLAAAEHIGFYHGSPIVRPPVGLEALFEGQARFAQLQYLAGSESEISCEDLRKAGYFQGAYVQAFEQFLALTKAQWPQCIESPEVGLFLLICDIAINPTRGFPFDIGSFEDFLLDVEPGRRFAQLCIAVGERHHALLKAIKDYSRDEYIQVAQVLCDDTGYDYPWEALAEITEWPHVLPEVATVMQERETFKYARKNLPIRVLFSHFVAFCRDKLDHPEFFCWPGAWMRGARVSQETQMLFLTHLSLFSDRVDDEGVFPRNFPGKDYEGVMATFNAFYAGNTIYDLTRQWVLMDGPFVYDYSWLSQRHSNEAMAEGTKRVFENIVGVHPDAFEIL